MINPPPSSAINEDQSFSSSLSICPTDFGRLPLSDIFEEIFIFGIYVFTKLLLSFSFFWLLYCSLVFYLLYLFIKVDTTATFTGVTGFFFFTLLLCSDIPALEWSS